MFDTRSRWRLAAIIAVWITPCLMGANATTIQSSPTDVPSAAYEHAQTLVTLPDGRRLNLFCLAPADLSLSLKPAAAMTA